MSAKVEDKAVEVIDKVANAVDAMTAKLATLAEKYGPEAIDAGLSVVRIKGASELIVGAAGIAVSVGAAGLARWAITRLGKAEPIDQDGYGFVAVASFFAMVGSAVFSLHRLLDIWNWVAVFEPKLWIAKKLLGL